MQNKTARIHFSQQPGSKFKTTTVAIDFVEPLDWQNLEKRVLLAELMENYSQKYASKLQVAQRLAELYGTQFGTSVFRVGNQAVLRFLISFADARYLPDEVDVIAAVGDFINEMIFHPLINKGEFPTDLFQLHQQNLIDYVKNLDDDKKYYASRQLQELYFAETPLQGKRVLGDVHRLQSLTSAEVAQYYRKLLTDDEIFVSALGTAAPAITTQLQMQFDQLQPTTSDASNVLSRTFPQHMHTKVESVQQQQSLYHQAYTLPVFRTDADYYAAVVMNSLWGGTASSLMFRDIRERDSLVYYINSSYDSTVGLLTIQSGIDGEQQPRVQTLIQAELQRLIDGDYSDSDLVQVKEVLTSSFKSRADSPRRLVNQQFLQQLLRHDASGSWSNHIQCVSKAEISAVARQLQLRATFFLKGVSNAKTL
ncbi:EF-P 5-aminopentanol modification-associated protein YfmF [Fructilactobacillus cliffordii]|uniref:Insulinase family protein n=1 Tax=Fructilactobacillus cliffordii TaxID=2940299 RepID=A0A9Q8ZQM3_9LACO|nr:insulinase family protein [Fructilactobacillus cliffordii]USS86818.1 insulinase family protein [Fructilactobacillus cliffordii]USS89815.1 insulinase family protein [Fructilactobacillus cliffordii]